MNGHQKLRSSRLISNQTLRLQDSSNRTRVLSGIMERKIQIADFELPRGGISIEDLIAMPNAHWEHLRAEITRRHRLDNERPLARCRLCEEPVYIRVQALGDDRVPMYAHFPGSGVSCPWHRGELPMADDPRAAQYQGHQESALHRRLCQLIADFLKADPRCQDLTVERYLRPSIAERGRYPDVYADMGDLGRFAVEVQLSKPFMPEIIGRHLHYEREGMALIWLFHELPDDLPQGFRDVITAQRGNAFLFDDAAIRASVERSELVIRCYLESDYGSFLQPRAITLDDLHSGRKGSVYFQDRRSEQLIAYCTAGRAKWWPAFKQTPASELPTTIAQARFGPAWDSIRNFVPTLSAWKSEIWENDREEGKPLLIELAAILFSIAHNAQEKNARLYLTRYTGAGALLAMLNAKLASQTLAPFASLIEQMVTHCRLGELKDRATLQTSFANAKAAATQISPSHPVSFAAARLFPEIYDGVRRAEMSDLGCLPVWAGGEVAESSGSV